MRFVIFRKDKKTSQLHSGTCHEQVCSSWQAPCIMSQFFQQPFLLFRLERFGNLQGFKTNNQTKLYTQSTTLSVFVLNTLSLQPKQADVFHYTQPAAVCRCRYDYKTTFFLLFGFCLFIVQYVAVYCTLLKMSSLSHYRSLGV